ncbi:MAG TPA: Glu/Leu/Phe/Val dehydrogenase family protein, partial [Erysipelotrichaceae bacterium]|nr:Glu/Leu/Phe/Val dehydrogenase family protein [Erysipelotrichaceae bacterium]
FKGIKACLKEEYGSAKLEGIKVAVSGVGHVGSSLCEMLVNEGAILTIADIDDENAKRVAELTGATIVSPDAIYDVECDVFAPCALGAVINDNTLSRLKCKIIAGCANNVLEDSLIHGTKVHEMGIIYAPDYVINAGGLINVYQEKIGYNKDASMKAIDQIFDRVREIIRESKDTNTPSYLVADRMAERRIEMMRNINSIHLSK